MNEAHPLDIPAALDRRPKKPEQSAGQLIKSYLEFRSHVDAESKRFTEYLKPFRENMQQIENELLRMLNEQKLDNFKSDDGTAYRTTTMAPKVAEPETWIDFCMEQWQNGGSEMFQLRAPAVEGLRNYMQAHDGALPPGVTVTYDTHVNIRKS
jgi:hypothetical protein